MEGEAHRDCTERPAWREGPEPVDYVDPPEVLHARTIDQLLGPKADYRKTRGILAPTPHRADCICGRCYDAAGGDMAYGAWVAALVRAGVLLRLADGRYVWTAGAKDELGVPYVAGPVRGDGTAWEEGA